MYFIVYLLATKKNEIVPHSWLREMSSHLETFINYGFNSNRKYVVFWTNKSEAFDVNGIPLTNYPPNIHAGLSSTFPNEGWYLCHIKRFKCKYETFQACLFLNRLNLVLPLDLTN